MKTLISLLIVSLAAGCGGVGLSHDSLASRQPKVVAVDPADGSTVKCDSIIKIEFSEAIDPASLNSKTLAVVKEDGGTSADELVQSVVEGDKSGVEGDYELDENGRVATFLAKDPYEPGAMYRIIATSGIMSVAMLPLNQRMGGKALPFVSGFAVEDGDGTGGGAAQLSGEQGGNAAAKVRPSYLVINELLYDVVGDDTDGLEFIELAGEKGGEIDGYKIVFISGDDGVVKETVNIPGGAKVGADGIFLIADTRTGQSGFSQVVGADFIDNFDPQNGPDCVQLLNDKGELIDALGYGTPIIDLAKNGLSCFEGTPAAKVPSGKSLSRTDGEDSDDNSADFKELSTPTPGVL